MTTLTGTVPLTTIWTPPAACATQMPVVVGGTCDYQSCTAYPTITSSDGWEGLAYWASGPSMVNTDCNPPSSLKLSSFTYSPAIGCPSGYSTLSSLAGIYDGAITAFCCPPQFTNIMIPDINAVATCYRRMSTAEAMDVLAIGLVSVYDQAGAYSYFWESVSTISTTLMPPTATDGYANWVSQTAVAIVIPSSLTQAAATATSTSDSNAGTDVAAKAGSLATTIGTVIGAVICILIFYCCCIRPCCRRRRERARIAPYTSTRPRPDVEMVEGPSRTTYDEEIKALQDERDQLVQQLIDEIKREEQERKDEAEREEKERIEKQIRERNEEDQRLAEANRKAEEEMIKQNRLQAQHEQNMAKRKRDEIASKEKKWKRNKAEKEETILKLRAVTCPPRQSKIKVRRTPAARNSMYAQMFDLGPKDALGSAQNPSVRSTDRLVSDSTTPARSPSRRGSLGSRVSSEVSIYKDFDGEENQSKRRLRLTSASGSSVGAGAIEPDYTGIQDQGPSRNEPRLSVPVTAPSPTFQPGNRKRLSQRASAGGFPVKPSTNASTSMNPWAQYLAGPSSPSTPSSSDTPSTVSVPSVPSQPLPSTSNLSAAQKARKGLLRTEPKFSIGVGGVLVDD